MQSLQSSHPTVNPRNFQDSLKLHPNNIAPCHEDRWSPRHTSWRWEPPGKTFQDIGGLVKLFIQRERCQYPCVLICVNFISNIHYIYLYTWNLFLSFVLGVEPPKKQVLFGFQVHTLYIISFVIVNTCNWGIYAVRSNRYINQFVLQVYTTCLHILVCLVSPSKLLSKVAMPVGATMPGVPVVEVHPGTKKLCFLTKNGEILYPHPGISWETY